MLSRVGVGSNYLEPALSFQFMFMEALFTLKSDNTRELTQSVIGLLAKTEQMR